MIIMHASDLHYCAKHLEWVDRAFGFACEDAIKRGAEIAVLSGDSFDAAVSLHEPAVEAFFARVHKLADAMPVIVLAGTASHDRPGVLSPLRHLAGRFPVLVADRISQAVWTGVEWVQSNGAVFNSEIPLPRESRALFNLLPSVNRGHVAAAAGVENASEAAGEAILSLCQSWAPSNLTARASGLPTIMVTHGTVNGSMTESATALVSPDHEFTAGTLFASESCAIMIGHIHASQIFENGARKIAYPGSITRLIYGHRGQVGYLLWDVSNQAAQCELIATPGREMVEIDFPGFPAMDELAKVAAGVPAGAFVRLRYVVDEEFRANIDKDAMAALFPMAAELKIEGRILPVQRQRAAGIGQAPSIADKIRRWCELTNTDPAPLLARLELLQAGAGISMEKAA